ncbi:uncharacterized protein LOC123545798 [Mercenaria mercenaria]|uniref:uncharacterized protein LOC123545798 n=1 Tax=Mercenaria mercenaria TaxID=6596 RepID=UPI00234E7832|nr:uncharacterized protein LOC123545798 [Mercenaria mercenaria]
MRHVSYTYKIIKVKGKETLTAECVECIVKILQYFSLKLASCEEQPALHLIVVDKDITDFAYVRNKLPENCENVVLIANNTPVTEAFRRLSKYVFSKTDILQCIVRVLITMWTLGYQQNIRLLCCCFQRNTELRYAYRVLKRMQVQMKLPQDKMSCFISSCIMSPTGKVIVSEFNNKSLKLLGHYEVLNVCNVPEQPCDMCIISNNKIAVSVEKKFIIFIVESKDNLEIKGSMKIGQTGIGIECRDEILYISDSQSIYMYTLSGELIQELFSDRSTLKTIERFKICEDGLKIYVTNSTANELIVLDIEGLKLDTFKEKHDPRIGHLLGLCTADYGIVFACDYYSETIVQVSVKRMELGTITGIKRPRCCCFDKDETMLYVGQADGNLVIFDMKQTRLL